MRSEKEIGISINVLKERLKKNGDDYKKGIISERLFFDEELRLNTAIFWLQFVLEE